MKFFMTSAVVTVLGAAAAAASPTKRQTDGATCAFLLKPETPLPSGTNLVAEFNFVIGRTLAVAVTPATIFNTGSTFSENVDGTWSVDDTLSVEGKTAAETASILEGFTGTTEQGFSGTNWDFESVVCN